MKNALNNQVGMLGDMFLWLVANLKQGVIYFIKQALPPNISAGSVSTTPITAMGWRQCLPLSVVQLKGKHCRKPHCRNGVVDTFGPSLPSNHC